MNMEINFKFSRFWTRIGAFLIDCAILGVIGFILGLCFEDHFISIGSYGILYGMIITIVYLTIFNSKLMNGQTIGKKIVNIQIVDKYGNKLGVDRSLYRALILCIPYYTVNLTTSGISEGSFIFTILFIGLFSLILGVITIYIFNSTNRQSLHDILIGSYVVSVQRNEELTALPSYKKLAIYIYGSLIIILLISTAFNFTRTSTEYKSMNSAYDNLNEIDGVINASVSKNTTTVYGEENSTTRTYIASLWLAKLPEDKSQVENMKEVREAVKIILNVEPNINSFDNISITLIKGFDIGISKKYYSYSVGKTSTSWKEFVK